MCKRPRPCTEEVESDRVKRSRSSEMVNQFLIHRNQDEKEQVITFFSGKGVSGNDSRGEPVFSVEIKEHIQYFLFDGLVSILNFFF
jgi:hypothetical protein